MKGIYKVILVTVVVLSFFCLMSKIDFIVHETLYEYGLIFSYEWALDYWITYCSIFIAFSLMVTTIYWLGSRKTMGDLKVTIALCVSINLLMLGGLQDLLFFVVWGEGLPNAGMIWWWSPWIYIFGTWNSNMQLILSALTVSLTVILWGLLTVFSHPESDKLAHYYTCASEIRSA